MTSSAFRAAVKEAWPHLIPAALDVIERVYGEAVGSLQDDYRAVVKENNALREQTACPECECATPEDAERGECGCDAPVCVRDGAKTLAEHYVTRLALAEQLAEAVRRTEEENDGLPAVLGAAYSAFTASREPEQS